MEINGMAIKFWKFKSQVAKLVALTYFVLAVFLVWHAFFHPDAGGGEWYFMFFGYMPVSVVFGWLRDLTFSIWPAMNEVTYVIDGTTCIFNRDNVVVFGFKNCGVHGLWWLEKR